MAEESRKAPPKKAPEEPSHSSPTHIFFYAAGIIVVILLIIFLVPKLYPVQQMFEDSYTYNYFDFVKEQGTWFTNVVYGNDTLSVGLRYGPRELEDIPVIGSITNFRDSYNFYYITFDPSEDNHDKYVTMSDAEVSVNLVLHFGKSIEAGCTKEDSVCNTTNTSIVTCDSTSQGVIFLNHAPGGPKIEINGNCAIITGEGPDMVRAADRFMYGMYGIMK